MMENIFEFYKGKRVFLTGHTGFKGSWLSIWLHELGAEVVGVGLEPYSEKDNFVLSGIGKKIKADIRADIRDGEKMKEIFKQYQPEIARILKTLRISVGITILPSSSMRRTMPVAFMLLSFFVRLGSVLPQTLHFIRDTIDFSHTFLYNKTNI